MKKKFLAARWTAILSLAFLSLVSEGRAALPDPKTGGKDGGPISILLLRGHAQMNFGESQPPLDGTYQKKLADRGYRVETASEWQILSLDYLRQFNVVCYLNPGPYLCIDRFLDATAWLGGIHLLTVQRNAGILREYAESGGGLFLFPALEEGGMRYMKSFEDLLGPYGIETECACVRDPKHLYEATRLLLTPIEYSWTANIAQHPITEGAKRVYYPSYVTRWDDNFMTVPLFPKDPAWITLIGSMPGTPIMMNRGSVYAPGMPWIAWPGRENPSLLTARDFGKGRLAICGISPFTLFYYTYAKQAGFAEANFARVDGISMEYGDGTNRSDMVMILDGCYRWLSEASARAGMGGYEVGKGVGLPPVDTSKGNEYYLSDRPTTDDPRVTGPVRPMKILVGAHSACGGGKGTPAEWAAAAKAAGYDVVCFTEHLDRLDPAKWGDYVAECTKNSDDQVVLIPGLDASTPLDGRFLIVGHYWNLRPHILTADGKQLDWTGHMLLGMEGGHPIVARPQWQATVREKGAHTPGNYKHAVSAAIATYDATGKLIDDGRFAYQWLLSNGSIPYPVAVHEVYDPSELAAAARNGLQNYYPYDTPVHAAEAFRSAQGNFGGNPAKYLASSGPMGTLAIDDWQKPDWTASLFVKSEAPITEVLVSDQRGIYRKFAPHTQEARLFWSGNLAVQHWFLVEVTDAKGGKAVFSPLRSLPLTAVVRCGDRQNYFTGMRSAALSSLYPGMNFLGCQPGAIVLPGVALKAKVIPKYEFVYAGLGYHILDAVLDSTVVPGGISPGADNDPSFNELPIPEYRGVLRVVTHTALPNKAIVLREFRPRVTLKQDLQPTGSVWPVFATVPTSPKADLVYSYYDAQAGKTNEGTVAKDGFADLPVGGIIGGLMVCTPMRVNGKGELGLAAPAGPVKAGTTLEAVFVQVDPAKATETRRSSGFAGATPYVVKLNQGKIVKADVSLVMEADKYGVAGNIVTAGNGPAQNGLLPLVLRGVNSRWPVGVWRPESGISPFACFEGPESGQLDPTKTGVFYFGNLLVATDENLDMAFVESWSKDRAVFEVCNPTAKAIAAAIGSPDAITDRLVIKVKVEVPAGNAVLVTLDGTKSKIIPMAERPKAPVMPVSLFNRKRILFYGDSLTDGSSYPDYVVHSLNAAFPKAGFLIENSAKCGDTTRDLLRRFEEDVVAKKPNVLSVCIGANDAGGMFPVTEYKTNLQILVSKALNLNIQPILFLTSPRAQSDRDATLQDYLKAVREVAAEYRLPLVDSYTCFLTWQKAGKTVLGPDGLHHGPDGFPAMARSFLDGVGLPEVPLIEQVTPWPGALTNWEVSAPMNMTADNKETFFNLENAKGWMAFKPEAILSKQEWYDQPFIRRGAVMPLVGTAIPDGEKRCAFARVSYEADEEGKADLQVGGSAPLYVYCNSKLVYSQTAPHGYHPNADRIQVTLAKGKNEFVVCSTYMAFLNLKTGKK
jgi:lysophospholipase L1-like esterase